MCADPPRTIIRARKNLEKEYARECLGKAGALGRGKNPFCQSSGSQQPTNNNSKRRERARDIIVTTRPEIEGALNGR
jgi:hypothetical protein